MSKQILVFKPFSNAIKIASYVTVVLKEGVQEAVKNRI